MNYKKLKEQIADKDNTQRSLLGSLTPDRWKDKPSNEVYQQLLPNIKEVLKQAIDKGFNCGTLKHKGKMHLGASIDFNSVGRIPIKSGEAQTDELGCYGCEEKDNKLVFYFYPVSGSWSKSNDAPDMEPAQKEEAPQSNGASQSAVQDAVAFLAQMSKEYAAYLLKKKDLLNHEYNKHKDIPFDNFVRAVKQVKLGYNSPDDLTKVLTKDYSKNFKR